MGSTSFALVAPCTRCAASIVLHTEAARAAAAPAPACKPQKTARTCACQVHSRSVAALPAVRHVSLEAVQARNDDAAVLTLHALLPIPGFFAPTQGQQARAIAPQPRPALNARPVAHHDRMLCSNCRQSQRRCCRGGGGGGTASRWRGGCCCCCCCCCTDAVCIVCHQCVSPLPECTPVRVSPLSLNHPGCLCARVHPCVRGVCVCVCVCVCTCGWVHVPRPGHTTLALCAHASTT